MDNVLASIDQPSLRVTEESENLVLDASDVIDEVLCELLCLSYNTILELNDLGNDLLRKINVELNYILDEPCNRPDHRGDEVPEEPNHSGDEFGNPLDDVHVKVEPELNYINNEPCDGTHHRGDEVPEELDYADHKLRHPGEHLARQRNKPVHNGVDHIGNDRVADQGLGKAPEEVDDAFDKSPDRTPNEPCTVNDRADNRPDETVEDVHDTHDEVLDPLPQLVEASECHAPVAGEHPLDGTDNRLDEAHNDIDGTRDDSDDTLDNEDDRLDHVPKPTQDRRKHVRDHIDPHHDHAPHGSEDDNELQQHLADEVGENPLADVPQCLEQLLDMRPHILEAFTHPP